MRCFIATAFLLTVVSAKSVVKRQVFGNPQVNCPDPFHNVPNVCKQPNTQVYHRHPTDVTKFLQCDVFGRMYIVQCPQGEQYDVATTQCTVPTTTNTPLITTTAPTMTTTNPNNPCNPITLAQGNVYFAYHKDVTKFIECSLNGVPRILACPVGLIWKDDKKACVYVHTGAHTGTTPGTHTPIPGNLTNPCTTANIAAKHLYFVAPDPHQFIQCDYWGDAFLVNCPSGMIWNEYYKTCSSPFINGSVGK